ncbi:MAG: transporter, ATP-binding protein [Candidatus Midichloriaceae bacterium]|jgi:ATP-binding cassette subfamily B protein|nr:transporter, ATP-binding protein [Candidatus Midichloriaceae bacterium]
MTDQNKMLPKTVFPFIWHFLRDYKPVVIAFIVLSLAAGLLGPFNSLLIKHIINLLPQVKDGDVSILILPAALIVINFIIFDNLTWRGCGYIYYRFTLVITNIIIGQLADHVLTKSHQFFQDNLSGKISKQITNLAESTEKIISSIASNFLRGISLMLAAFIAAYSVNPIFCFILVVWFALFASISILMSRKLVSLSDAEAKAGSIVVGEIVDSISNQSNIRMFARRIHEDLRLAPFLYKNQIAQQSTTRWSILMTTIQGTLIAIMIAFSCYFLIYLYSKNLVTIGDFALILGLSMETGHTMWFTMSQLGDLNKAVGRCKQSLLSLLVPLEIQDSPNAKPLECKHGKITFDKVKFHYKGTDPLFKNKSVEIKAGQKVGLVGYSGGGKSTFANLIMRLYDVTDGAVLIDDQDIRYVTQDSLRESIAMIPQDPSLFDRSLMDNIRYGRIEATDEEVIEAAKKAHAHEFISTLPQGYESLVGERGVKLSGGQRQRIAIARAILKNAPILILDEATSQLDSVTENLIQESIWELIQGKTSIVIAHRLSTLLLMDRILVFDKGKIVEDGPHKELVAKNGLYKKLWSAQVGGFLSDGEFK